MINLLSLDVINKEAPYKVDWDEITGSYDFSKYVADCLNTGLIRMSLIQNIPYIQPIS